MFVFHDTDGNITFTANGERSLTDGRDDWIEVPAQELGELTAWRVVNGELVLFDMEPYRKVAKDRINSLVGDIRLKYITNIPGQDPIYLKKEIEAKNYLSDPSPNMANYPFLSSEIGITAETAYQLAQIWLYMSNMWNNIAASLEAARLGAQRVIESATTVEQINVVVAYTESQLASF